MVHFYPLRQLPVWKQITLSSAGDSPAAPVPDAFGALLAPTLHVLMLQRANLR